MEAFDESPEDLRAQSIRESDLLCGIFGGKLILPHEILSDVKQLEQLAHLQESLEWFASTVRSVAAAFEKNSESEPDLVEPIKKLYSIAQQFQDIADTCLLVMHLEIRVHCFFYLLPVTLKGEFAPAVDSQVADPEVVHLNRDLMDVEAALSSSLQPVKNKYIFEGVGQLVSTILINGAQDMRRINDNGVKKICRNIFSIQQTLCNLTNQPEHALDHARTYFELFTHPAEEMVDTILEKGPQFKELEYVNALKLLFRSKPGSRPEALKENLERLSNILGDVGVTV
jgi:exocyst complex component 4